ncbi:uncharacterized protein LOC113003954 [Solenopsis invicta]|uniref:uncharacterized protein LOC113003954 n=1 Tax=Solenopsis invicta TaxID=13686 RepID=UPI00193DC323|nr:uncharacterized protein LOC113003954 [Solenopsis invicta]
MSELRTLKQKRARAKGNITRMRDRVQSEEGISKYEAEARQLKLEELWKQFEDLQLEIEMKMQPSEDRTQEQIDLINYAEREIVETVYYETAAKIREIVEMAQNRNEQERQVPVVVAAEPRAEEHNVKLPILKIPEFRGDYDQWLTFKGLFKSMFHENRKLTSVQKFQYLKSSLQGEALQIIGGFEISSENYEPAWELLTSTYDNKRLLINTHMNRLLTFPTVEKGKYATIKQIIIHVRTHIKALNVLELPVEHWDELLIHLIKDKLDYVTQKNWEEETRRRAEENRPTLEDFLRFLSEYARTMELIDNGRSKSETAKQLTSNARMIKMEKRVNVATTSRETCDNCSGPRRLFKCEEFLKLSIPMRADKARQLRLCLNCFGKKHFSKECYSGACKKCGAKHNTLLHREESSAKADEDKKTSQGTSDASALTVTVYTEQNSDQRIQDKTNTENKLNIHIAKSEQSHVILSTAQVLIEDINGERHLCRALLDPGAQTNVITRSLFNKMRLKTIKTSQMISGINGERVKYTELARVKIKSVHTKFETEIECVIMPTIIEQLLQVKLDKKLIPIAKDMQLTDPEFHEPNNIDLLIGAGLFWRIFCRETMPQQTGVPSLQKTLFGWIIGGELQVGKVTRTEKVCGILADVTLKEQLERFWKVEEISEICQPTEEEVECEENFKKTVERTSSGRFIVSLPRKQNVCLGESKEQAERRLLAVEKKFKNDSNCKEEYIKFMADYESKEHMSRILASTEEPEEICWLPHQAVFKTDGLTIKIRVVFDASSKTSNGQSLNDKLQAGPHLQNEMFDILLRFRTHQFVFSADIEAMYRQILVTERDRHLQRILWRSESTQPMQAYSLNTVTYGTTAAPFLAIRCLRELAQQEDDLLEAANVVRHDFYMDDVLSGAATEEKAIQLRKEVTEVLKKGQFRLRKWRANHKKILEDIKEEDENDKFLKLDKEGALKILGLLWDATTDTIQYSVSIPGPATVTRRSIVSQVAQIFDPLGLLGPILIKGKCIMQQTWQIPIGWDEPLPKIIQEQWQEFYDALQELNEFKVMRNLNPGNQSQVFDIMGFGDASEKAYGACLYAVSKNKEGNTQSFLICSRSKIAPLKTISLPRLELNAALILAKLTATAIRAFGNRIKEIHLWSDSSIVLHQINTSPNLLKTYAANRVTKIQQAVKKATWHHVPSSDNPADVLSRGSSIEEWKHSKLWWHGPWWIDNPKEWPQLPQQEEETKRLELKKALAAVSIQSHEDILGRFSSYDKLLRVSAYCLRFKNNCKQPRAKIIGPLTVQELNQAEIVIIRLAQAKA